MNRFLKASQCAGASHMRFHSYALRPSPLAFARPPFRRPTSTVGADKTGFIDKTPEESLLYFDNVFPLKTALYDIRYLAMHYDSKSIDSRIKSQCLPADLWDSPDFQITGVIPRKKDGGAFLKFISPDPARIEDVVQAFLKETRVKPWFAPLSNVRSFLVRGKPWLEDLYRFPSTRLKVEFVEGKELSQEALYALFRRYGKIADITITPPGGKEPRFAIIQFLRMRGATSARNCLHGFVVPEIAAIAGKEGGVTLRILYERGMKPHYFRDWMMNHPRIVLPILAALVSVIAVWIFDPVRTFFIHAKITRSLHFSENEYWGWVKKNTVDRFVFKREQELEDLSALWEERKGAVERINGWLQESEETFIVVQGPRGSGKRELIMDSILRDRKNVLLIDCEPINEAHGDSATIAAAALQVGYRPVFSWLNTISSLLDLAAQGTIGTTAGFSQTLENQFNKILQNTGVALKTVALAHKYETERDKAMSDDEYLSANPQLRPIVVIDNFLHHDGHSVIYDKLADWAALLVSSNVAHVIFLTNDIGFQKSLAKSLPDRVFRTVFLGDAKPESAKRYVLYHLDGQSDHIKKDEKLMKELDESIVALGGRLTDLEFLSRRIKAGETPHQAVHEIILNSASEILKLYFLDGSEVAKRKWTPEQAWYLVKRLTSEDSLRYNEVLLHDFFKSSGGEDAVQALEQAEMVSIINKHGRPYAIKPGKPVYRAAFERLLKDEVLKAKMDMVSLKAVVKAETVDIKKCEEELQALAACEKKSGRRVDWLVGKIDKSQRKVEDAEAQMVSLKKVLQAQF
ncbi:RNA12 protein-domain-containing protein [Tricharina praecox]|uniref:RNA12 protein-domain-containing protein n=1 Tax=Tricharina praecox TaxID=43433 RepID=UPI002220F8D4|nr:RNA12 protein-domain-containing protein [Tricharina praecox]KAI5852366.1 RNA12 protein-domain-containing protein [Tricharina praecox]